MRSAGAALPAPIFLHAGNDRDGLPNVSAGINRYQHQQQSETRRSVALASQETGKMQAAAWRRYHQRRLRDAQARDAHDRLHGAYVRDPARGIDFAYCPCV